MIDSEKYCEGKGEKVFYKKNIEKLLKFKTFSD